MTGGIESRCASRCRKVTNALMAGAVLLSAATAVRSQDTQAHTYALVTYDPGFELVGKYLNSAQIRHAAARGVEMEEDLEATVPKLGKAGTFKALRRVSCTGPITYQKLDSAGDVRVNREVIARYLAAESEPRDPGSIAITPANYEFRLKATLETEARRVWIFRLKPREKRLGLFKGELWLDAGTGMPLRESGQFVRVPSIFLKRIRFVRDYEIHDGVSIPKSMESTVETRLVGRAELRVHFRNLTYVSICACQAPELTSQADSSSRLRPESGH
jgi:hypothetical protein